MSHSVHCRALRTHVVQFKLGSDGGLAVKVAGRVANIWGIIVFYKCRGGKYNIQVKKKFDII